MFERKESKKLKAVKVWLTDGSGKDDYDIYIAIPEGGRLKITEIGNHVLVYNKEGDVIHRYTMQAGYSQKFEYIYKD